MKAGTIAWYWAAAAGVLALLWLLGLPLQLVLDEVAGKRGRAVAGPVFGLFAVVIGSWYVLDAGASVGRLPVFLGAGAFGLSVLFIAARSRLRRPVFDRQEVRESVRRLSTGATVFALNLVMSFFTIGAVYAKGSQTALSLNNSDIAAYAAFAQHFIEGSFRGRGPVVGYDMGAGSKHLGYGADAVLAFVASVLRTDVLHVLHLTMLVGIILGVYSLTILLQERLGVSRSNAILASQAAYGVFFVVYLQNQFYLSQMLAMALLPGVLALLIDVVDSDSGRILSSSIVGIGFLAAAGIGIYPQMVLPMSFLFIPAAALLGRFEGLFTRSARAGCCAVCGVALGAATAPALARIAWQSIFTLATIKAGYPLPGLLVTDLLGFQTNAASRHSGASWWISGALLLVFAFLALWLWRRHVFARLAVFTSVAVTTILLSYLLVFWYEGVSYQQWKWITFFTPLLVALLAAETLSTLSVVRSKLIDGPSAARAVGTGYLVAVTALALPASFSVNAVPTQPSPDRLSPVTLFVASDAATVEKNPRVQTLTSINIDVDAYWDTMWLIYFLRHKRLYVQSQSYYPTTKPGAEWTIQRNDMPSRAAIVVRLNATYRLVQAAPA